MLYTMSGSLPRHQYVYVEPNAIGNHSWLKGVWFALCSYPGRIWGCHLLLECGAIYRNVPLHQIATREGADEWTPQQAATWDAYGWQFSTIEYPYLMSMDARVRLRDRSEHDGQYLFTAVPTGDAFSAHPEQAKEFYFIALDNGRLTAQPTNHVLIQDRSFTGELCWPTFLKRQARTWSAENLMAKEGGENT